MKTRTVTLITTTITTINSILTTIWKGWTILISHIIITTTTTTLSTTTTTTTRWTTHITPTWTHTRCSNILVS